MDRLCHFPKAVIPNCMQLGTNLIRIEVGWGWGWRGDSDKFSKRFLKTVGVERYSSVVKCVCMRPQVQSPKTPFPPTPIPPQKNPVSEGK